MPKKRTPEEQREYMRIYRDKGPDYRRVFGDKEEEPNPENTISNKGEGVYGLAWDGVIGGMSQQARDAILKRMGQTKRG